MKYAKITCRILLGLIYFGSGLAGLLMAPSEPPPELSEAAAAMVKAFVASGYFLPMVKLTEVLGGALLLSGFFVPLALVILAPVTINIVLFHGFLAPQGMYLQVAMVIVHVALGYFYRDAYSELLKAKPT